MERGRIVCSKAGRDKGCFMVVIKVSQGRVFVADGKSRNLEKPKAKNPLHLAVTRSLLDKNIILTNKSISSALHDFAGRIGDREET